MQLHVMSCWLYELLYRSRKNTGMVIHLVRCSCMASPDRLSQAPKRHEVPFRWIHAGDKSFFLFAGGFGSWCPFFPFLQIPDKADNDIYPWPEGIFFLRITFAAPNVCYHQGKLGFAGICFQAVLVKQEQVGLVRRDCNLLKWPVMHVHGE